MMVVTHLYVSYLDNGQVVKLENCPDPNYKTFEIAYKLVQNLYDTRKNVSRYKIDYFYNIAKGIVEDIKDEVEVKTDMPFVIPLTSGFNNEITFEHRLDLDGWIMHIRSDVADKINLVDSMKFYITKKDDPHFLLGNITLDFKNSDTIITDNKLSFSFAYEIETNLNDFSLVVIDKIFKSYGIKEKNVTEI